MKLIGMISGCKFIKTMSNYVNIVKKDIMMKQRNLFKKDKMVILLRSTGKDLMIGAHYTTLAMRVMMILLPFYVFTVSM